MNWPTNNYGSLGQGYNPAQTYLAQPQISPQQAPVMPLNNMQQTGFRCVPVTSQSQAETIQIPFDGSTTYFVDTSNGKIYAKTFDFNTGAAPVVTYVREQAVPVVQYATIDDINALREEIDRLKKPTRKAVKNDDSDE